MKIVLQYGDEPSDLSYNDKWDVAFIGENVDDRCNYSYNFISANSKTIVGIKYDVEHLSIYLDGILSDVDNLEKIFEQQKYHVSTIIIDATSVGVVEFLILSQTLYNINNKSFDILYLEPKKYKSQNMSYVEQRNFELSDGFYGYIGIPGHTLSFERTDKAVFLCGYESERLDRTFEELDIVGNNSTLIFGMPPFSAGWDMNSYSNHISVIEKQNISKKFYYCGAANPLSVCEKLDRLFKSLDDEEKLFIIPIGTKPMSIGACLYKISKNCNDRISILYDHPTKTKGRSIEIARWNLYKVKL